MRAVQKMALHFVRPRIKLYNFDWFCDLGDCVCVCECVSVCLSVCTLQRAKFSLALLPTFKPQPAPFRLHTNANYIQYNG